MGRIRRGAEITTHEATFKQEPGHRGKRKNTHNSFPRWGWRWGADHDLNHLQCQRKEAGLLSCSFQLLFNFLCVFVLLAVYPA